MITKPAISIIVPVYKAEKYLHRCVDSILAQTFTDFEVLLIDDGSTDKSGQICDEYAQKDSRIRVFHKNNGGVSSARNVGIENARGKWLYFPDADDELYDKALEILFKKDSDDIVYVMAGYSLYNESGVKTYSISDRREVFLSRQNAIRQMFAPEDYLYHGYLWNKLFLSDIIYVNNIRFDNTIHFNEDRLFNVLYLLKIGDKRCFYTTEPVYKYIERSESVMSTLKIKYNSKYSTDLIALIYMVKALAAVNDSENLKLCKREACKSYAANISMMKKFKSYSIEQNRFLYKELRRGLSIPEILYYCLRNKFSMLKYKFLKYEKI